MREETMPDVLFKLDGQKYKVRGDPSKPIISFGLVIIDTPSFRLLTAAQTALADKDVVLLEKG
jgi:hypothetical protein